MLDLAVSELGWSVADRNKFEKMLDADLFEESLNEDAKAHKYKAVASWEGTFCGEKRVYKNDRFHTYEFDHEPTKQEVEDKFYNDPNIIRLKNWRVSNVRKEVKDFMDEVGAYGNEEGWKDIKLTDYKLIKENLNEASSAETRAYKNGGKDADDLIQGKAIARIKDPAARDAAVAAIKAGRPEVAKQFYGDRKEAQALDALNKKQATMAKAGTKEECLKEDIDKPEVFTPEEQEEYNCDEEGYCEDSYDQLHHCGWCGDVYAESEMRHEADFGWICSRCEDELRYHGGQLTFIENEDLEQKHDEDK